MVKGAETRIDRGRESGYRNAFGLSDKPSGYATLFDKRIWTIKDVALVTGYSVGTLYNLTSKGIIPHRKRRGKLYFLPTEILNWIEEGDVE